MPRCTDSYHAEIQFSLLSATPGRMQLDAGIAVAAFAVLAHSFASLIRKDTPELLFEIFDRVGGALWPVNDWRTGVK
jgi:hypothetical protein